MKKIQYTLALILVSLAGFCQSVEISPAQGTMQLSNTSIRLTGAERPVFIHEVNPGELDGGSISIIDNPLCNSNNNAMLIVTPYLGYTENTAPSYTPVGVFYDALLNKWKLISLDFSTIATGAKYFILVINQ